MRRHKVSFWGAPTHTDIIGFIIELLFIYYSFYLLFIIVFISLNYFDFEKNYDVLKSKSPCILLNHNMNFNKNETGSKMENPSHSFRDMNLAL